MANEDIVLITIDALRHDAVGQMPNIQQHFDRGHISEVITAGAATNWVFPAILAGSYYTRVYDTTGMVRDEFTSLPDVLQDNGYATGAFLGFNPYLNKWKDRFDSFWNGGLSRSDEQWYSGSFQKWLSRSYRTAFLKKRVPAGEVIRRARSWYSNQSGPKFLWIHIMEPHGPYYPGFRRGMEVGLFRTYRSILNFQRYGDDTDKKHLKVQRELYQKCIERVDSVLPDLFDFIDNDATVIAMGDHGEEFEHGHIDHERLYDECVRVPLFTKGLFDQAPDIIRQIDMPAEVLNQHGISIPDQWDGEPVQEGRIAYMMTPRPSDGTFQCAVRTTTDKLIRTYDREDTQIIRNEYYNIREDPEEKDDKFNSEDISDLEAELSEFMSDHWDALDMDPETGEDSDMIKERLENLGYK